MQLSREELSKLDLIIERYTDDTTSKEAVAIETYLNKIDSLERELLIAVYFNLSHKPTDEENKIIDDHKTNLFNLLSEKGYIKNEKKRTTQTVEQRLNNEKKQKLNRYRDLRVRHIYWWRYLMVEEWKEVARLVGLKSGRYCMKLHNEYLEDLEL